MTAPTTNTRASHRRLHHTTGHYLQPPSSLQHTADTDLDLLTGVIEANQEDSEFFIRKAIGWALRDYARTDGDWVRAFVQGHPDLSPLSRREALKHL